MSYWDFKKGKKPRLKKCPICGKKARLRLTRSYLGDHPNNDKVWFQVKCSFCNTCSDEFEGCWADESAAKDWNSGDVDEDKAVKKLLRKKKCI